MVVAVPAGPADAAAVACGGVPATVVGDGGDRVDGTDGDDVIVSGGSRVVSGGDGSDLICVTGGTGYAYGGDGDDDIRSSTGARLYVDLGAGADSFRGGPGRETVDTGDRGGGPGEKLTDDPDAVDVVRTFGGHDQVKTGGYETEIADVVELGSGDDTVRVRNRVMTPDAKIAGGPGKDLMVLSWQDEGPVSPDPHADLEWSIDNDDAQEAVAGSETILRWSGLEQFQVSVPHGPISFTGNAADELFESRGVVVASMGGGDDLVHLRTPTDGARLRGGGGYDDIALGVCGWRADVDLASGTYACTQGDPADSSVAWFEEVRVAAPVVDVSGTRRADKIRLYGCRGTVSGLGGADHLANWIPRDGSYLGGVDDKCNGYGPWRFNGGPGNDYLLGSRESHRLDGGPGRDTCERGPVRVRCEVELP